MSVFYPTSFEFVKKRARQLKTTFPVLSLSTCQTAVACALGFKNNFDALSRVGESNNKPSEYDEFVTNTERLERRYQQIRAITDCTNLPASTVEILVREWNLTSENRSNHVIVENVFRDIHSDIVSMQHGQTSIDELLDKYDDMEPVLLADGLIYSKLGYGFKNYYVVGHEGILEMPIYLRGNRDLFLKYEDGNHVRIAFPAIFSEVEIRESLNYLATHEPWLYEWHLGEASSNFEGLTLKRILNEASRYPEEWFALSVRFGQNYDENQSYAIPALRGVDFARFIHQKGSLRGLTLRWFRPIEPLALSRLSDWRFDVGYGDEYPSIRIRLNEVEEIPPLYGSPFKSGPMHSLEYSAISEGSMLMLDEELEEESDEQDS